MRKFRWLKIDNTYMLMGLDESYLYPEWHPVAQVTLRQVYASRDPRWHVWVATVTGESFVMLEDRSPYREEAMASAERKLSVTDVTRDFSD